VEFPRTRRNQHAHAERRGELAPLRRLGPGLTVIIVARSSRLRQFEFSLRVFVLLLRGRRRGEEAGQVPAGRWRRQHFVDLRFIRFRTDEVQPERIDEPGADISRCHSGMSQFVIAVHE
jgi:hypothetical protein